MSLKGKLVDLARSVKNAPAVRKTLANQALSRWTPHDDEMAALTTLGS